MTPYSAGNLSQPIFPLKIAPGTEGAYLSPGNPNARNYLVKVVSELSTRYPVDGIHFDYIRYPNSNYDYSPVMRREFYNESGVDPLVLFSRPQEVIQAYGNNGFKEIEEKWNQFRQAQIERFLIEVKNVLPRRTPPFLMSAAVKPEPETGRKVYLQNWVNWLEKRLIDLALPMNYSASLERFEGNVEAMLNEVSAERLCVGIGLYTQSKYRIVSKVYKLRAMGIKNVCFFSYDNLIKDPSLLNYIENLP